MEEISSLDIYDEFREEIQAIFRSRLLTQMLVALGSGAKSLSDLRDITGSSSQALIPKIRQLESAHYIESERGDYVLTPLGRIVEPEIERLVTLMGVLQRHRDFWTQHDIESIPAEMLKEIGDLYSSEVVRDVEENIFAVYTTFLNLLQNAKWIHAVSSIMSPAHAEAMMGTVRHGKSVELVISADLADTLIADPYSTMLRSLEDCHDFRIYVSPVPVRLGMTVTDSCLSLGLYKRGTDAYDTSVDLISFDATANAWGERLFQYYRQVSEPLVYDP
ncbi:helix-turn-helix transcriptional regulator [Methanoculleus frigidifontis]|nr:transcriptional regulator FilR1 domain-containing protein [Methanoculleus sp. FWC-SCC1]